ncbi:MAG: tetratricopeptide repeat protein [candidate division Zixibacteria bacterium]
MKYFAAKPILKILSLGFAIALISSGAVLAQEADDEKTIQAKESFNTAIESMKSGDTAQAIGLYNAAITANPEFTDAYLNLGSIYFAQKKYGDAGTNFKKVTELAPNDPVGFSNYGKVLAAQKNNDDAVTAFEGALAADAAYAEANKELGKLYYSAKEYDKAITSLENFIKLDTKDYYTYYLLAAAYKKAKNYNKAVENYKAAINLRSNHFESIRNLANLYRERERFSEAITYYKRAIKLKPKDYKTAYNLAVAVQSNDPEDYATAITSWNEFLKVGRKNPKARKQVANAEQLIKQLKEAKEAQEMNE